TGERFSLTLSNNKAGTSLASSESVNIYKANETTVIELEDDATTYIISAYNALGQKVMEDKTVSNTNRYTLNNEAMAKGLVIIKVTSSHGETVKKLTY
ncbi:MAG: T9SS type A sorting domain-containing protein, partial [Flavobacteriales bacterium]|nr:T9SS type A sorting domain-containing protein [Flavobacteriales bacterium]